MERLVHSFKTLWRAERVLRTNELRLNIQKVQLTAAAGLVGLFGLVMLSLALFFALAPHWGQALAALTISGIDILLAAVLVIWARAIRPSTEVDMVTEVRDMALKDIEHEFSLAEAELVTLKDEAQRFLRNPIDAMLPSLIIPLLSGVAKGFKSRDKK